MSVLQIYLMTSAMLSFAVVTCAPRRIFNGMTESEAFKAVGVTTWSALFAIMMVTLFLPMMIYAFIERLGR